MKAGLNYLLFAALLAGFTACQKSVNELTPPPEDKTAVPADKPGRGQDPVEAWAKIYPAVAEPRIMDLGTRESVFFNGEGTVLYVLLTDQAPSDLIVGEMVFEDANTGEVITTIPMVPYYDPTAEKLVLPEDIKVSGAPFLFTPVQIDDQFMGRNISLRAFVKEGTGDNMVKLELPVAFSVQ